MKVYEKNFCCSLVMWYNPQLSRWDYSRRVFFLPSHVLALFLLPYCHIIAFPKTPLDLYKCQHSSSLISSIKKRIFGIFERDPSPAKGIEHTITCFQPQRSTTWANEAWLSSDGILVDVLIWVSQFLLRPIPLHAQNFCAIILILVIGK